MPEKSVFRTPFQSERVHWSETQNKSAGRHFYLNSPLIQDKLSWKKSLLVRDQVLTLFGNTLTASHMYSPHN